MATPRTARRAALVLAGVIGLAPLAPAPAGAEEPTSAAEAAGTTGAGRSGSGPGRAQGGQGTGLRTRHGRRTPFLPLDRLPGQLTGSGVEGTPYLGAPSSARVPRSRRT